MSKAIDIFCGVVAFVLGCANLYATVMHPDTGRTEAALALLLFMAANEKFNRYY